MIRKKLAPHLRRDVQRFFEKDHAQMMEDGPSSSDFTCRIHMHQLPAELASRFFTTEALIAGIAARPFAPFGRCRIR
jgi:hypothetical protein